MDMFGFDIAINLWIDQPYLMYSPDFITMRFDLDIFLSNMYMACHML